LLWISECLWVATGFISCVIVVMLLRISLHRLVVVYMNFSCLPLLYTWTLYWVSDENE
jgi:uncharacterized membrane protein